MHISTKEVRDTVRVLDEIVKAYKESRPDTKRDWRTYEQQVADRIRSAVKELEPLIDEAIAVIHVVHQTARGRHPELSMKQKTILLLLKHLFGTSNREMSSMLVVFSLLSGVDVSYKTVERLYSDEEVAIVLHNLHILLLKKKGVEHADCTGDGTGHSVTVTKHYASEAHRLKEKAKNARQSKKAFTYSFRMMDLKTRMYIGHGTSMKSEKEAFLQAAQMARQAGIRSIRIDRYYSAQKYVKLLERTFPEITIYLIPKSNATVKGPWVWKRTLHRFVNNTNQYLQEYYRREQSESGIGEDKHRFGRITLQRREDRIDTAEFCTVILHNLFWLHGP